jgi:hypothetical protein
MQELGVEQIAGIEIYEEKIQTITRWKHQCNS